MKGELPRDPITVAEGARMLRVHLTTMYRFILRGQVPAVRVGGRWRLSRADVLAFVRRTGPAEAAGQGRGRAPVPTHAEAEALLRREGYAP
jgi:excisionase family DNA binding protein